MSVIRTIQGHGSGDRLGQHETYLQLDAFTTTNSPAKIAEALDRFSTWKLASISISSRTEALDFQPMVEQNMVPPMCDQAIEENLGFSGKRNLGT